MSAVKNSVQESPHGTAEAIIHEEEDHESQNDDPEKTDRQFEQIINQPKNEQAG